MCKVFGVAGINNKNRGDIIRLVKEIGKKMVINEKDGFGYAAINSEGKIHGEKWLKPEHIFSKRLKRKAKPAREVIPKMDKPILEQFKDMIEGYKPLIEKPAPPVYDNFGEGQLGDATAIIMHSRFGTGASVEIQNVHPFFNYETALVHNGIVYNEDDPVFYKSISDCDSEIILNQYNSEIVQMDARRIEQAMAPVEAYFACLVLTQAMNKEEKMYPVLDIFKADANLDIVYIHDFDVFTFCTKGSIVVDICKEFGYSTSRPISLADNFLIRIDTVTGKITEKVKFRYTGGFNYKSYGYGGWDNYYSKESETYYKSKYGEDWENAMERDMADDMTPPNYKEYSSNPDPDEPSYRKNAEQSAKVFLDKGNSIEEMTSDPLDNGSTFSDKDINDVILNEEEMSELEKDNELTVKSILDKHRDKGTRHA